MKIKQLQRQQNTDSFQQYVFRKKDSTKSFLVLGSTEMFLMLLYPLNIF